MDVGINVASDPTQLLFAWDLSLLLAQFNLPKCTEIWYIFLMYLIGLHDTDTSIGISAILSICTGTWIVIQVSQHWKMKIGMGRKEVKVTSRQVVNSAIVNKFKIPLNLP